MKIFDLKKGDIVVQNIYSEKIYFKFDGCDGMYGKFIELNKNKEPLNLNKDFTRYTLYTCFTDLKDLGLEKIKD